MSKNNSFVKFLDFALSQKEVSLAIAQNPEELKKFREILNKNDFKEAKTAYELLSSIGSVSKNYFVCGTGISKEIYDFMVQYPTGQIEIFDKEKMESKIAFPVYNNSAVVFLIGKKTLSEARKQGFDALTYAGLTYQS